MYVEKQHSQKTRLFPASAGLTNMPKPKDNFANATEKPNFLSIPTVARARTPEMSRHVLRNNRLLQLDWQR
jgi:hypothetical protein